jgi:DNA helicase HerA-like ATPase
LTDLFVFDEAASIFRKWYEDRGGTYLLTDYLAQSREFGIGFIISTQNLSNLADTILSNSATKIMVGGAGLGRDYDIFGSAIGLTSEQKEHLKALKSPGVACISDSRYPHPFLLEVPKIA